MFLSSGHLQIYSTISELHKVTTAGRGVLHVVGIGDVNIEKLWTIKKVFYGPYPKTHLISLHNLVNENGWRFILDSDDCFLCDKVSGKNISSFRREDGL